MIRVETIRDIDTNTKEGKLLMMALAALTSLDIKDIKENKWGGMVHPDDALERVADIANQVYYEDEWKAEETSRKRNKKISDIINEESN